MTWFWNDLKKFGDACAFTCRNGITYKYSDIEARVNKIVSESFSFKNQLVILETSKSIDTVLFYLAALRSNNPVLLIDNELELGLREKLIDLYCPRLVVRQLENRNFQLIKGRSCDPLPDELAVLLSTSGSTGDPKLVKLSKNNIQSNAESIVNYLPITKSDKAISLLPFNYSYGLSILNSHLLVGAAMFITPLSILSRGFWNEFKAEEVTSIAGVPYIYEILEKLRFVRMELPSLKYMTQAGGKLNEDLVTKFSRWCDEKGITFYVMYGQTEATARISYLEPGKLQSKPTSIGKAIPGGRLELYDNSGELIRKAEIKGELVFKGSNVMIGYASCIDDLYLTSKLVSLKTGDIAFFDSDGDFYIVGRAKRFIKMYGLRVNLDEVEQILNSAGFFCVCGGKDDLLEIACIKPTVKDDVKQFISHKLKFNVNSIHSFDVNEFARTPNGKIDYKSIFGKSDE
ncbi:AMP-binding protein [Aliikangiella sp. IMCC44653]